MKRTSRKPRENVLIIEDNETWQRVFRECVERLGFAAIQARSAAEAQTAWQRLEGAPALVISDIALHGGPEAGLEFVEDLSRASQLRKCVVVTSFGTGEYRQRAAAIGATFLLKYDLNRERFLAVLRAVLAGMSVPPSGSQRSVTPHTPADGVLGRALALNPSEVGV